MRKSKAIQRVKARDDEGLTAAERVFVDAFVSTGDVEYAFTKAGIEPIPFRRMIERGQVRNAVVLEAEARVQSHAFIATSVLLDICRNSQIAASTRVDAAKALRAPFMSRLTKDTTSSGRTLAEYTIGELRALVNNLETQRSEGASLVNGTSSEGARPVNGAGLSASHAPLVINPDDLIG